MEPVEFHCYFSHTLGVNQYVFYHRKTALLFMKIVNVQRLPTGIRKKFTGYSDKLPSGAPPNLAMKFVPLTPYLFERSFGVAAAC